MYNKYFKIFVSLYILHITITGLSAKRHRINIKDELRSSLKLGSPFGLYERGYIALHLIWRKPIPLLQSSFGLTLSNAPNSGASSYYESKNNVCPLKSNSVLSSTKETENTGSSNLIDSLVVSFEPNGNRGQARFQFVPRSNLEPGEKPVNRTLTQESLFGGLQISTISEAQYLQCYLRGQFFDHSTPDSEDFCDLDRPNSTCWKSPKVCTGELYHFGFQYIVSKFLSDDQNAKQFGSFLLTASGVNSSTETAAEHWLNSPQFIKHDLTRFFEEQFALNRTLFLLESTLSDFEFVFAEWLRNTLIGMGGRTTPSDFSLNVPLSSGQKLPSAPPALASNSTLDVRVVPSKFFDAARPFLLNGTLYNDKQLGDLLDMPHTSASQFLVHHKDYTSSYTKLLPLWYESHLVNPLKEGVVPLVPALVGNDDVLNMSLLFIVPTVKAEGEYSLQFRQCGRSASSTSNLLDGLFWSGASGGSSVSFQVEMCERNPHSYLGAGDEPLPWIYFAFSALYFLLAFIWLVVLIRSPSPIVFRVHWLMLALGLFKSFSILFHGINNFAIGQRGVREEAWAVMYYVTHLLKGVLLFLTLALIGAGWALFKHILSDRDKKILIILIPLQVLANVAQIIMEENDDNYGMWYQIAIIVDLICCGAILLPIIWTIKHLQRAAQSDGKQALSLYRLKLFRQFYLLVVCYIYFTRIMAYLIEMGVNYRIQWIKELFIEISTVIFFVFTAYKFRPAPNNPYLTLQQEENEDEEQINPRGPPGMVDTVHKTSAQRLKEWIQRNVRRVKREDTERERVQKERELAEELELPLDDEEVAFRVGGNAAAGGEVSLAIGPQQQQRQQPRQPSDPRLTIVDARDELVLFDARRAPRAAPVAAKASATSRAPADPAKRPLLPPRGELLTDELD